MSRALLFPLLALGLAACQKVDDTDGGHDHPENELVTTVELTLTPPGGSPTLVVWTDPENDGSPVVDTLTLTNGVTYDLTVRFLNALEDPAEDLTPEIEDEGDQHQVFFTGPATGSAGDAAPATPSAPIVEHTYADTDDNGLPLGLENTLAAFATGSDDLIVTLRHLPPENGADVKVAGLAETVANEGFAGIGGDNDAMVLFPLIVE